MKIDECRNELHAAEADCVQQEENLRAARQRLFEARMNFFTYNAFDPKTDKPMIRELLLILADENSPFSDYVRRQQSLRPIIEMVAALFDLKNESEDQYTHMFKLPVVDEDSNTTYGVTMTYRSGEASIEAKPLTF
jgi:hypothetical protein